MRELCHLVVWVSFFVGSQVQRILDFGMLSFFAFQSANKNIWPTWPTSRPPRNSMGIRRPFWLVQCGPPFFAGALLEQVPFCQAGRYLGASRERYSFLQLTFLFGRAFLGCKSRDVLIPSSSGSVFFCRGPCVEGFPLRWFWIKVWILLVLGSPGWMAVLSDEPTFVGMFVAGHASFMLPTSVHDSSSWCSCVSFGVIVQFCMG